ncbi:MAG TPA: peptide chain release factor N(5)-glutamine methyltransferase [Acidimicrobiales bacterium]|nr:peptide chain release factor N(5)-glutamine methyltransferase [Acidimicrobiales bacterium]
MTDANAALVRELVDAGLNRREVRWLVEEFLGGGNVEAAGALRVAAKRRLDGEPLQYIIGHWPFRSLDLDLDGRVLIPRPETEELVTVALGELARRGLVAPIIVDLGCGSGAIGLSLLQELRERGLTASVVLVDASLDALAVARRNARKHSLEAVSFVHSTWFESLDPSLRGHVDLLVANPPYVSEREFAQLDAVLRYEPRGAIVAPDDGGVAGFGDLRIIIHEALAWLAPGGLLVCEHADTHRGAVLDAATAAGFGEALDLDDATGRPRVLVASR